MNGYVLVAFFAGLAVLPVAAVLVWMWHHAAAWLRWWWTRPRDLTSKTMRYRRAIITGLVLELLDAQHVRAIRLPFNRIFIIRSNPKREYDFVGNNSVLIGDDYEYTRSMIGGVLDKLGYAEEPDS